MRLVQSSRKVATGIAVLNLAGALALGGLLLLMSGAGSSVVYAAETSAPCPTCETFLLASVQAVNTVVSGPLNFAFWVGVVLIGLVLPLGVEFGMILRGVEKPAREVAVVLGLMVLVGGFILRAVIVFGGQI